MHVLEKRYRLLTTAEEIEHQESKVAALGEDLKRTPADHDRLMSASWHLQRAAQLLRSTSLTSSKDDLVKILEVSIDGVRGRRREVIGAENNNAG